MDLSTKYEHVRVGIGLGNGHFDIDKLYQDVMTYRACIGDHHLKPGTDKFHECFEMVS
jgi:hypothetical protein